MKPIINISFNKGNSFIKPAPEKAYNAHKAKIDVIIIVIITG